MLLLLGVRAVYAIGGVSMALSLWFLGPGSLYIVSATVFGEITDTGLLAIPLFVLMANFLIYSDIADHLFQALEYWMSGVKGSLAVVTVLVSTVLAMCGGFGPGIITMSLIGIPAMLKRNYHKSLALGSVMAGGVLGDIIPPSIIMILYGYITRLSVGKLFMAGILPGLICAFLHVLSIVIRCQLNPKLAPRVAEEVTWEKRWISLKAVVLPALLIVAVLGTILRGIATPTEAAGVGALGAFLCTFLNRTFSWGMTRKACRETLKVTGMVLWIVIAANLFRVFFTTIGARTLIIDIVGGLPVSPWIILVMMQVILFVLGMFMDDFAITLIVAPIFTPIATCLGFDPIWFAMVFILNMEIAYLTPPFGWALIMVKGMAPPGVTTGDVWRAAPLFMANKILALLMVILIPSLTLWLPGKIIG